MTYQTRPRSSPDQNGAGCRDVDIGGHRARTGRVDLAAFALWLAAGVLLPAVTVATAGERGPTAVSSDDLVAITLVKPRLRTEVLVPVDYLGPRFLGLSRTNRLGGEQKRFLVEFYYPSMLPNTPANDGLMGQQELVYASITNTDPASTRRFAVHRTESDVAQYKSSGAQTCELDEYSPKINHLNYTVYIHRDKDELKDVYIQCPVGDEGRSVHCRFIFETASDLSIVLNGMPQQRLCDWRAITSSVRDLANSFIMDGSHR